MSHPLVASIIGLLALALVPATPSTTAAAPPSASPEASGDGSGDAAEAEASPPNWRFRRRDRPVKVVVLAGSIGAFPGASYSSWISSQCRRADVQNLSQTGFGAYQLRKRFRQQVLDNPRVNLRDDRSEYWLVFQGGLNSVADPHRTNYHIRSLFVDAHERGIKVVGLSLTPWGAEHDRRRWAGLAGLAYRHYTQMVVDYVTGRASPEQALGSYVQRRRGDPAASWQPHELADIGIDLYDSALRDRGAELRSIDEMRELLTRDRVWQKEHRQLSESERVKALERDAVIAAELPRWYWRPEFRGFDHIHPNADGHRAVFDVMCPKLPASWECDCSPGKRSP